MSSRSGVGLVVSASAFGERDALVRVLCPERGLISGLVKGGKARAAAVVQPFNSVGYEHYRRLEGQLGTMTLELRVSRAGLWLGGGSGGYVVAYLSELLGAILPEEHGYAAVVARVEGLLERLSAFGFRLSEPAAPLGWREVVGFEMFLLETVGYGLRLREIVEEGEERSEVGIDSVGLRSAPARNSETAAPFWGEVAFVSPSSGRSVTRGAARGWEGKLLELPHCMGGPVCGEVEDFRKAWTLTGSFLKRALHGKQLAARGRLAEYLVRGMERDEARAA